VLSFAISRTTNEVSPVGSASSVDLFSSKVQGEETRGLSLSEMSEAKSYQQTRLSIKQALEQCTPLLLEVMAGGYDYTSVLLPVLEWLIEGMQVSSEHDETSPRRVVVACATQQQARRLIETALPKLQAFLKSTFAVAYLAERGGYLCTHRWFGAALRRTS